MLRVLTLSSLFPDATRPNFGVFVEQQTLGLAAHHDVELRAVAPDAYQAHGRLLHDGGRVARLAACPCRGSRLCTDRGDDTDSDSRVGLCGDA